jgi:hypothetical protein
MIAKRFNVSRAREEIGEAAPWETMLHAPQFCQCRWCAIARERAVYTVTQEDSQSDIQRLAELLTMATLNSLRAGVPVERVVRQAMEIMRAKQGGPER